MFNVSTTAVIIYGEGPHIRVSLDNRQTGGAGNVLGHVRTVSSLNNTLFLGKLD